MRVQAIVSAATAVILGWTGLTAFTGCASKPTTQPSLANLPSRYPKEPPRQVPDWLKGSIMEQVDLYATEPNRVSNFGLVILNRPTGDARNAPNNVREFMIREMTKRGFGNPNYPGIAGLAPEQVLRDPRAAIVRVQALVPPGAVKGQRLDVQISALENSDTTSLAGGTLFTTDLYNNGDNLSNPGAGVDLMANARGYVFVNPAYALDADAGQDPTKRRALTSGIVLAGGRVAQGRPLVLRIRPAERRISRMTEQRIDQAFHDARIADAKDEGIVWLQVPERYRGDWEHFAGVVLHTFWIDNDGFAAAKAIQLTKEIEKPGALVVDISYAWEALNRPALPAIQPLYSNTRPEVAFAAARAGAYIGDSSAEVALAAMAHDATNPFRLNATKVLADLPESPAVNARLRDLVATSTDTNVRIEAYRGLARNNDSSIQSFDIGGHTFVEGKLIDGKFKLDLVPNDGPPLVFATRSGIPRIAFIGGGTRLPSSTFFSALDNALTISPVENQPQMLSIFYRGPSITQPVQMLTRPDLADLVSRLGGGPAGADPDGQRHFDFTYGEIVALMTRMADQHMLLSARNPSTPSTFVLQEAPEIERNLDNAPVIPEGPRPVTDAKE